MAMTAVNLKSPAQPAPHKFKLGDRVVVVKVVENNPAGVEELASENRFFPGNRATVTRETCSATDDDGRPFELEIHPDGSDEQHFYCYAEELELEADYVGPGFEPLPQWLQ